MSSKSGADGSRPPSNMRMFLGFIRPHWRPLALSAVFGVIATVTALWLPRVVEAVINALATDAPVTPHIVLITVLTVVGTAAMLSQWVLQGRTSEKVAFDARSGIVARLLRGRVSDVAARSAGDLVSRATADPPLLQVAVGLGFVSLITSAAGVIATIILMGVIDRMLLLITLGAVTVLGLVMFALTPKIGRERAAAQTALGEMSGELEGSMRALRTVKVTRTEGLRTQDVLSAAARARTHGISAVWAESLSYVLGIGGMQLITVGIIALGAWRVSSGYLSIAALVAFIMYVGGFIVPLMELADGATSLQSGLAAAKRIAEVHEIPFEEPTAHHALTPGWAPEPFGNLAQRDNRTAGRGASDVTPGARAAGLFGTAVEPLSTTTQGRPADRSALAAPGRPADRSALAAPVLEFCEVTARYPDGDFDVVENFSLQVPRRGHVVLVGPNGAGKSTVLSLALRFLEPTSGEIRLDGVPYRDLTYDQVRSAFAYVEQETAVVPGTIRENLMIANPQASEAELNAAMEAVHLTEEVRWLSDGLDTELTPTTLTLGQRQSLAMARALLSRAPILLLDEATSQIGGSAEATIHAVIKAVAASKAVLTVAHRLSTVVDADLIVEMHDGRVRDAGTHEELLARDEMYQDLVAGQLLNDGR